MRLASYSCSASTDSITKTRESTMAQSLLRRTVLRRQAISIRTVCAWCATQNRPAAVLVDVPLDARGMSHGICPSCRSSLRADSLPTLGRALPRFGQHGRVDELR
jgi:hypothetical protein